METAAGTGTFPLDRPGVAWVTSQIGAEEGALPLPSVERVLVPGTLVPTSPGSIAEWPARVALGRPRAVLRWPRGGRPAAWRIMGR